MISQLSNYRLPERAVEPLRPAYVSVRTELETRNPDMYYEDPVTKTTAVTKATVDARILAALG